MIGCRRHPEIRNLFFIIFFKKKILRGKIKYSVKNIVYTYIHDKNFNNHKYNNSYKKKYGKHIKILL